jgi:hypothetical protein
VLVLVLVLVLVPVPVPVLLPLVLVLLLLVLAQQGMEVKGPQQPGAPCLQKHHGHQPVHARRVARRRGRRRA